MACITRRRALAGLFAASCAPGQPTSAAADIAAIETLMHATWDRPEAPLDAGPIVVDSDVAIADWTQGAMGGRALLRKTNGRWVVTLCSGDGLRTAAGLQSVGIAREQAVQLGAELAAAEASVSPTRLAAMARFAGAISMSAN